jgi:Flp pilus assembly protein TadG
VTTGGLTRNPGRPGAVAVETAVVLPVFLFILLAIIVGGMGVFRYQQVACLAREAARRASVCGADYQKQTNQSSPTQEQICQQAVLPLAAGMDPASLNVTVQWVNQGNNTVQGWDSAPKDVKSINALGEYVTNAVRVTVTYTWTPGLLLGPITLTSVSQVPMSF